MQTDLIHAPQTDVAPRCPLYNGEESELRQAWAECQIALGTLETSQDLADHLRRDKVEAAEQNRAWQALSETEQVDRASSVWELRTLVSIRARNIDTSAVTVAA